MKIDIYYHLHGKKDEIVCEEVKEELRPVVRGEWVETEMYYDDYAWVCSVCGEPWTLVDGTPSENNMNYCPNCGAEMRRRTND